MKNQEDNNHIKWILEEGMHKIPSENFNKRVIEKFMYEREMIILKPGINCSLLLISAALILLLAGLILYAHGSSNYFMTLISDIDIFIEKLYIALFVVTTFSIFTVINDILEDRGGLKITIQ